MAGGVLGLDLAPGLSGWCAGNGESIPTAWAFRLPSVETDLGEMLEAYSAVLDGLLADFAPELVVYESPILTPYDKLWSIRRIYSLGGETERLCRSRGVRYKEVGLQKVKKELAGSTQAKKADMVRCATKLGITLPPTKEEGRQDAADAVGCWLVGLRDLRPAVSSVWDSALYSNRGGLI